MKVIHVNDVAAVGSTLVRGLREQGVDAQFLAPRAPFADRGSLAKVISGPMRALITADTIRSLRKTRPDLVHLHNARHGIIARLSGAPFIIHCHGTDVRGTRPGVGWGRELAPILRGAALVLISTPDLSPDVKSYGVEPVYLPNPIEVERFAPSGDNRSKRDVLIGVSLTPVKGAPRIVSIARQILQERPDTTFTVIDQGPAVQSLVETLGDAAKVEPKGRADSLPDIMHLHRLALGQMKLGTPGVYELECLAAGLPVVMTAPWNRRHADPAPFVDADDDRELAERSVALLDSGAELAALSLESQAWVRRWHEVKAVVGQLMELYRGAGFTA